MRLPTAQITSLLGSLVLHACALLVFVLAARRQPPSATLSARERPDAWRGASAVEVDAVATPDATPNLPNAANSPEIAAAPAAAVASEAASASDQKPRGAKASAIPPDPATADAHVPSRAQIAKAAARERRPRAPARASANLGAASAPATEGSHADNTPAATGAFGSEGLPPGVRSLPSAFARAIPPATGADPIWQSLPTGTQKPFILAIEVDAEGHIASAKILGAHDGEDTPPQFEHLRQRVIALLGGGLFALQNNGSAGRDLFRITITLSDRAVKDESEPAQLVERGFDPPRGNAPGRAYFTLASGRHFEAKVEVLGSPPRAKHP